MKKLLSLMTILLLPLSSFAQLGTIQEMAGKVFVKTSKGLTLAKLNQQLVSGDEVLTEDGSQISIISPAYQKFDLAGSGRIIFKDNEIELRKGYLKVESKTETALFKISTPNSVTSYKKGESIVSYDLASGSSQILVVNGEALFASSFKPDWAQEIKEGEFSVIKRGFENGFPRTSTPIGYSSFKKVTSLFKKSQKPNIVPSTSMRISKRALASVEEDNESFEIIKPVERKKKLVAKKVLAKTKKIKASPKKSEVVIRTFKPQYMKQDQPMKINQQSAIVEVEAEVKKPAKTRSIVDVMRNIDKRSQSFSTAKLFPKKIKRFSRSFSIKNPKGIEVEGRSNRAPASASLSDDQEANFRRNHMNEKASLIGELENFEFNP